MKKFLTGGRGGGWKRQEGKWDVFKNGAPFLTSQIATGAIHEATLRETGLIIEVRPGNQKGPAGRTSSGLLPPRVGT